MGDFYTPIHTNAVAPWTCGGKSHSEPNRPDRINIYVDAKLIETHIVPAHEDAEDYREFLLDRIVIAIERN